MKLAEYRIMFIVSDDVVDPEGLQRALASINLVSLIAEVCTNRLKHDPVLAKVQVHTQN
jgi:hypothetical protein